jgi:predicted RNase H-like nuclease (RuvC/YqgF family)
MNVRQAKNYKIILTALLVGITIFSVFKYVAALKEKYDLLKNLSQVKGQVVALEQAIEKEKELQNAIAQENSTLKDELKANTDKLTQLDVDLQNSQKTIEQLTSQIALSQAENTALREEKDKLTLELTQVSQERDTLKARLSSIPELKKAIKEAKMQIPKVKAMIREITRKRRIIEGNRGFLIKNGMSTFPITKIKIEVMPASTSK